MPHKHKHHHLDFYNKHVEDVTGYFKDRPEKLLIICWENGDGWEKLSSFLGVDCPNIPLPHTNKRRTKMEVLTNRIRKFL